jgi:hypothetical protein
MPAAVRIEAVRTARGREESGEVTLPVSGLAVSPTYAVKLVGPEGQRWVVASGLSGEVRTLTDDAQVEAIFAAVSSRRDAD